MRVSRIALLAICLIGASLVITSHNAKANAAGNTGRTPEYSGYEQPLLPQARSDEFVRMRSTFPVPVAAHPWEEIDFTNQSSALWRFVYDAAIRDNHAYCAAPFGLMILDVAVPASPTFVSQVDIPIAGGFGYAIALAGDYAYVAGGGAGLCIYDVSNVEAPTFIGAFGRPADRIAVQGGFAYLSTDAGLKIFSLTNPAAPVEMGTVWVLDYISDIAVMGERVYLANSTQGLTVVDVSDPASPNIVTTVPLGGDAWQVAVDNSYVYVSDQWFGIRILDLSSLALPSVVGAYPMVGGAYALELSGSLLYVSERTGDSAKTIRIVDISNAFEPQQVGSVLPNGYPSTFSVDGSHVYVAAVGGGLQVLDASNPAAPLVVGGFLTPGRVTTSYLVGGYSYVGAQGLQVLNWEPPARPVEIATLPIFPADLVQVGSRAYVAAAESGLVILDVTDPAAPAQLGQAVLSGNAAGVEVAGEVAYVAASDAGLHVIDVTNPSTPSPVGSLALPGTCFDVESFASYALVAAGVNGIHVVDVSNWAAPILATTFSTPGIDARRMAVKGNYLYVAGGEKFCVIDISNPAAPVLAASLDLVTTCVSVHENYAILGSYWGVYAVNIASPAVPVVMGLYDDNQSGVTAVYGVAASPDYVFAASYAGLRVLGYDFQFRRGDVNVDGKQTSADIIYLVNHVFKSGAPPQPSLYAGDTNGDWFVNTLDIIVQVNFIFKSGA